MSLDTHDDVVRLGEGRLAGGTHLRGGEQLVCTVDCRRTRKKRDDAAEGAHRRSNESTS